MGNAARLCRVGAEECLRLNTLQRAVTGTGAMPSRSKPVRVDAVWWAVLDLNQ